MYRQHGFRTKAEFMNNFVGVSGHNLESYHTEVSVYNVYITSQLWIARKKTLKTFIQISSKSSDSGYNAAYVIAYVTTNLRDHRNGPFIECCTWSLVTHPPIQFDWISHSFCSYNVAATDTMWKYRWGLYTYSVSTSTPFFYTVVITDVLYICTELLASPSSM